MPAPPADVAPNELISLLINRPRPSEVVEFPAFDKPGKPGKIRIQVLSKDQHDKARFVARKRLKEDAQKYNLKLDFSDERSEAISGVEGDLSACEVLAMACRTVTALPGKSEDDPLVQYGGVFTNGSEVGSTLTADEVAYLFSAYNLVQHRMGPNEVICSEEDIDKWILRLVEGAAQNPFLRLSAPQWAELLTKFAGRLYKLSGILVSQWGSLPDSLKSELLTFCLATTLSGQPAESSSESLPALGDGEISMDQAMRFSRQHIRREPIPDEDE